MFANMPHSFDRLVSTGLKLGFVLIVLVIGCGRIEQHELRVATAANVQYAVADIVEAFYEQTDISVELIIGSSGKLSTQIAQGAPFDIFISADMEYPGELYRSGYAYSEPKLYAYGEIVIWTMANIKPSIESMLGDDVQHVAVPNPKTAPYGLLAIEALTNAGILETIRSKLVYGANVGQVSQFIASGAAKIGITAKSMIMSTYLKDKGNWVDIPEDLYARIGQGIIIIDQKGEINVDAQLFYDFMFSDIAHQILVANGYKLPES
jgi:molybdate transport system substrate-binding protein